MDIIKKVETYYTDKIKQHGVNSHGVDWNSKESQFLRFEQLSKVIKEKNEFSILDFGCGYGALIDFLNEHHHSFDYLGFDISQEMLQQARTIFSNSNYRFSSNKEELTPHDYVIASGIFNVKLDASTQEWEKYILETINELHFYSKKGFSFDLLTSYSDKEYMKDYLYYANPVFYFDFCKRNFSKNVALLHDYDLYEFTLIIRK